MKTANNSCRNECLIENAEIIANQCSVALESFEGSNHLFGYRNCETGETVIPCKFESAKPFNGFFAKAQMRGRSVLVTRSGGVHLCHELIFCDGRAKIRIKNKWGFIDSENNIAIPFIYNRAGDFCEEYAHVQLNGKWGFVDRCGNVTVPFEYDEVKPYENGIALVKHNGKWGCVDISGKECVPAKYDFITLSSLNKFAALNDRIAYVYLNGKRGVIDLNDNILIPIMFETIEWYKEGVAKVKMFDQWYLADHQGSLRHLGV